MDGNTLDQVEGLMDIYKRIQSNAVRHKPIDWSELATGGERAYQVRRKDLSGAKWKCAQNLTRRMSTME